MWRWPQPPATRRDEQYLSQDCGDRGRGNGRHARFAVRPSVLASPVSLLPTSPQPRQNRAGVLRLPSARTGVSRRPYARARVPRLPSAWSRAPRLPSIWSRAPPTPLCPGPGSPTPFSPGPRSPNPSSRARVPHHCALVGAPRAVCFSQSLIVCVCVCSCTYVRVHRGLLPYSSPDCSRTLCVCCVRTCVWCVRVHRILFSYSSPDSPCSVCFSQSLRVCVHVRACTFVCVHVCARTCVCTGSCFLTPAPTRLAQFVSLSL